MPSSFTGDRRLGLLQLSESKLPIHIFGEDIRNDMEHLRAPELKHPSFDKQRRKANETTEKRDSKSLFAKG